MYIGPAGQLLVGPLQLLRLQHNALVLPTSNVFKRAVEVLLDVLQPGRVLVRAKIRVDELNQAVDVLCRDLFDVC